MYMHTGGNLTGRRSSPIPANFFSCGAVKARRRRKVKMISSVMDTFVGGSQTVAVGT